MARPRATGVQQNSDGRFFVKVDYSTGRRVYLSRDERQSTRWATCLEKIDDHDEAHRRIAHLKAAKNKTDEDRRLARFLTTPKLVPALSREQAATELLSIVDGFVDEDTEFDAESELDNWIDAGTDEQRAILLRLGVPADYMNENPDLFVELSWTHGRRLNQEWMRQNPTEHHEAYSELFGREIKKTTVYGTSPSDHRIGHAFGEWARLKGLQPNPPKQKHAGEIEKIFAAFVTITGNKPVNLLTKGDFIRWKEHVLKQQRKGNHKSVWFNKRMGTVRNVLRFVARETDWDFPEALPVWVEFSTQSYQPDRHNAERMPVATFKKLLKQAEKWANLDADAYANRLYREAAPSAYKELVRANCEKQALRTKRRGMLFSSLLRLACNCGYDNECAAKITGGDLRNLDGDMPYIELGRSKAKRQTGADVLRKTPLLPATVVSLRRWIDHAGVVGDGPVFVGVEGVALRSDAISGGYNDLAAAAEVEGWTMKHLRNVGPSLGRVHKRPDDERQVFLGHIANGTNVFYEDPDLGPEYLLDLVDLVGADYFGETVKK